MTRLPTAEEAKVLASLPTHWYMSDLVAECEGNGWVRSAPTRRLFGFEDWSRLLLVLTDTGRAALAAYRTAHGGEVAPNA